MLRKIQVAATVAATVFSVGALLDLVMERAGKLDPAAISGGTFPLSDLPFAPEISGTIAFLAAGALVLAALCAQASVLSSLHAGIADLDRWRRMTWGASIAETAGCLLFVFSGTLIFLPSALALLLVGVAELATIWRDMERRSGRHVRHVVTNGQRSHP